MYVTKWLRCPFCKMATYLQRIYNKIFLSVNMKTAPPFLQIVHFFQHVFENLAHGTWVSYKGVYASPMFIVCTPEKLLRFCCKSDIFHYKCNELLASIWSWSRWELNPSPSSQSCVYELWELLHWPLLQGFVFQYAK